jgi:hypothetical protein
MGLVSDTAMNAVEDVLDIDTWTPVQAIVDRAEIGNIRTVRSALAQLREEGRVIRGGQNNEPVYQRVIIAEGRTA